jgi:tRNA dimethylallyltransferase
VIAGPTASGKTAAAIRIAQHFHTEIVSADARQFYREMSIGTAKPSPEQLAAVPHHLVGNKSITELYGAGHFGREAMNVLKEIFNHHDIAILTGGSGLYIDAVVHGVDDFDEVPEGLREALNAELAEKGADWLRQEVQALDPAYYATADSSNPRRLLRALEVIRSTGRTYSEQLGRAKAQRPFTTINILLDLPRETLYERIDQRVDDMMRAGLAEEARKLYEFRHYNALKTVGYKELFDHFDGKTSLETAVALIKQHTRNYAKRQLTWFRNRGEYARFNPSDTEGMIHYIEGRMR